MKVDVTPPILVSGKGATVVIIVDLDLGEEAMIANEGYKIRDWARGAFEVGAEGWFDRYDPTRRD